MEAMTVAHMCDTDCCCRPALRAVGRSEQELARGVVAAVTHRAAALEHGTRIVGFRAGRVVVDGPPAAVSPTVVREIYGEDGA